jgi:hypothetical protein
MTVKTIIHDFFQSPREGRSQGQIHAEAPGSVAEEENQSFDRVGPIFDSELLPSDVCTFAYVLQRCSPPSPMSRPSKPIQEFAL